MQWHISVDKERCAQITNKPLKLWLEGPSWLEMEWSIPNIVTNIRSSIGFCAKSNNSGVMARRWWTLTAFTVEYAVHVRQLTALSCKFRASDSSSCRSGRYARHSGPFGPCTCCTWTRRVIYARQLPFVCARFRPHAPSISTHTLHLSGAPPLSPLIIHSIKRAPPPPYRVEFPGSRGVGTRCREITSPVNNVSILDGYARFLRNRRRMRITLLHIRFVIGIEKTPVHTWSLMCGFGCDFWV